MVLAEFFSCFPEPYIPPSSGTTLPCTTASAAPSPPLQGWQERAGRGWLAGVGSWKLHSVPGLKGTLRCTWWLDPAGWAVLLGSRREKSLFKVPIWLWRRNPARVGWKLTRIAWIFRSMAGGRGRLNGAKVSYQDWGSNRFVVVIVVFLFCSPRSPLPKSPSFPWQKVLKRWGQRETSQEIPQSPSCELQTSEKLSTALMALLVNV